MAISKINGVSINNIAKINGISKLSVAGVNGTSNFNPSFKFKVKTNEPGSASDTFILPLYDMSGYSFRIDWGDTTSDTITTWDAAALTHVYAGGAGIYTIEIKGTCPRIYFNYSATDRRKIIEILDWGNIGLTSCNNMFAGCNNLTSSATDAPDLSGVTDMSGMFALAWSYNGAMNSWDVSTITDMSFLFNECVVFNQPLNSWDVSSVTNMEQMFYDAEDFNQDIGDWVPSSVLNMRSMFAQTEAFNQDLDAWDVSSVNYMTYMFQNARAFNGALNGWDVSSVTTMYGMFSGADAFNKPLSSWDVSSVEDMSYMLESTIFDQDLGGWDVTALTDATGMFRHIALSTANYDALLIGWAAQAVNSDVTFGGGNSTYTAGGDAEAARDTLLGYGWDITDGGEA
jgi:surface protein